MTVATFWTFLIGLPLWTDVIASTFLLVCLIIAVIFIVIKGKYLVLLIWNKLFGKTKDPEVIDNTAKEEETRRTCGDCILLMMTIRENYEHEKDLLMGSILKSQMNFAEQKLIELQHLIYSSYVEMFSFKKPKDFSPDEENIQITTYYGLLRDTIWVLLKDEIRRSFKENNFQEMSGMEFSGYVKNKFSSLLLVAQHNVSNRYPRYGMLITSDEREKLLINHSAKMEDMLFEIFVTAKTIKTQVLEKLEELNKKFKEELDALHVK